MGKSIYRFRQINSNSISAFMNDEMYGTTPDQFNDPYDVLFNYDPDLLYDLIINDVETVEFLEKELLYELLKENKGATLDCAKDIIKNHKYFIIDVLNRLVLSVLLIMRRQMIIICFCKSNTKEIMWSHYSNYGKGFALEYDEDDVINLFKEYLSSYLKQYNFDFLDTDNAKVYGLKQVDYNSNRFDGTNLVFKKIKEKLIQNELSRNKIIKARKYDLKEEEFNSFVLYKSLTWSYEDEIRLIVPNHNLSNAFGKVGVIRPKAVYLGEFISFNDKYTICSIAKTKGIPIYKMVSSLDKKRFGLKKCKLTEQDINNIIEKFSDQ